MPNTKKFAVKNGLQSQNIDFISPNENNVIQVTMLDTDTLAISGNSGQLFSVTDSMTGSIFAVNDISGVPSIEVFDTGTVQIAETFGNVLIGTSANTGAKLQVNGAITATMLTSNVANGTAPLTVTSTTVVTNLNADLLDGQHGAYYTNATNLSTGTLPTARLPALTGDATSTAGNNTLTLVNTGVTAGSYGNSSSVPVLTIDAKGRVTNATQTAVAGVSGYSYTSSNNTFTITTSAGSSFDAKIDQVANFTITGNLTVSGTTTYVNSTELNIGDNQIVLNADLPPATAPSQNAGLTVNRGSAANVEFVWNETDDTWAIGNTNVTGFVNASSTVTGTRIISTVADGTAPLSVTSTTVVSNLNADKLDGQDGSYYRDASNLNAGTVPAARLPQANTSSNGAVVFVDSVSNTATSIYAPTMNAVKTAYDAAIAANTLANTASTKADNAYSNAVSVAASDATAKANAAYTNAVSVAASDATTKANAAYSNAIAYSSNATNLSSGTVASARLPQANTTVYGAVMFVDSVANTSTSNYAPTMNAVKTAYDAAIAANTLANTASTKADSAYSNAVTYSSNASNLTSGTVAVARLPAFTGDVTSTAGNNTLTLVNTAVTAGTYGNSSVVPQITVDSKGRITGISNTTVAGVSGLSYTSTNNTITLTTTGGTYNATINQVQDLTINGNLTVSGVTTYINTTQLNIGDNQIVLNADLGAVAPTENAGFIVNRGSSANVEFTWDEANDTWDIGNTAVTGFVNATSTVTGTQLVSTVALGTAPLSVVSNTAVTNLNADLLDGFHATYFANATHTHSLAIGNGSVAQVTYNTTDTLHVVGGTNVAIAYDDATNKITISSSYVDTNTTYSLLNVANTVANRGLLRLNASTNANTDVGFVGGGATTVSSNSTAVLISSTDTLYDHLAVTTTGGALLRLHASTNANDDIKLASGNNVTVVYTDDNTITINSSYVDTNTTYDLLHVANTTQGIVRLSASTLANDDINFVGAGATTVSSNSTAVIISSTDTNTTYSVSTEPGPDAYSELIRLTSSAGATDDVTIAVGAVGTTYGLTIEETGDTITLKHADTSTQASVNNSGRTYIQDITLDEYGHITGIVSATETVVDTNTTYDLLAVANTVANQGTVRLKDSANANDDVTFTGAGIAVVSSNATHVVITATEADTLSTVTGRGATTTAAVGLGNTTVTGFANVSTTLQVTGVATFSNNVTVAGNLTVSGTTTYINTTQLNIGDNIITLNADLGAVAPTENAGIEVNRGTSANVSLLWDETNDYWSIGNTAVSGFVNATSTVTGTQLVSTVAVGTKPLSVTSTTLVDNLNADLLDGNHASAFATAGHTHNLTIGNGTATQVTYTSAETLHVVGGTNVAIAYDDVNNKVTISSSYVDTNTTYDLVAVANTVANQGRVRLTASTLANDDVLFVGSGSVTVSSNTTQVTISGVDTNTTYDLLAIANASVGVLRLKDSANANDDVIISGSGATSVSSNATHVVISSTDNNTTYDLLGVANTTQGVLRLASSGGVNDDINITGSGATTVTSNATHIIISSTDNNTDTLQSISDDTTTNATYYPSFVTATSGAQAAKVSSTKLTFNPSTGLLTASGLSGSTLTSTVATGTAPLTVTSTTAVTNLNADLLDGNHASAFAVSGHNHTYNVNDAWLRDNGDDATFKQYGNSRQMVFRTDGTTEYSTGVGASAFIWMYGGDAVGNKIGSMSSAGDFTLKGTLYAASKSFLIPHPTKESKKLRYGSLEGPENGVYIRGKLKGNVIELPEYWTKLVDPNSITVNLTPIGKHQKLYVEDIRDNKVFVANEGMFASEPNCFYTVFAERVDIAKLEVEVE